VRALVFTVINNAMKFNQLYHNPKYSEMESVIADSCSTFIHESMGTPVFKLLPRKEIYEKVKIRVKSQTIPNANVRDAAFNVKQFDNRSLEVFTTSAASHDGMGLYYIFPVNGYKFIYNTKVDDIVDSCKKLATILPDKEIITEVLRYSYNHDNLLNGLEYANKIKFFNIPYFYAIKASLKYQDLYKRLTYV